MKSTFLIKEDGRECSKCSTFKIWDCFPRNKQAAIGYGSSCKACNFKVKQVSESKRYNLTVCNRSKHPEVEKGLMTTKHPEPIKDNYWEKGNIIRIGENFHPYISTKIK